MVEYFWFGFGVLFNVLLLLGLTLNVVRVRLKHQIALGDGGNKEMQKAIRAHANSVEQVPIFMMSIWFLSVQSIDQQIIAGLVVVFAVSRVVHAIGMLGGSFLCRRYGALTTFIAQLVAGGMVLIALLSSMAS